MEAQEEHPVKIPGGSILKAHLYIGSDPICTNASNCDLPETNPTKEWKSFMESEYSGRGENDIVDEGNKGVCIEEREPK